MKSQRIRKYQESVLQCDIPVDYIYLGTFVKEHKKKKIACSCVVYILFIFK